MQEVFIIDGIRTPIGSFGGSLSPVRPDDLATIVIRELLKRNNSVDPSLIDEVIMGCANQAGEDNRNVARMASLMSGLPYTVPAETINILCASGMAAIANASRAIRTGDGNLYLAGGVESMTRAPFVLSKSEGAWSRNASIYDTSIGWRFVNPVMKEKYGTDSMGETAENVAEKYSINRDDQDVFAFRSQQKATLARNSGRLSSEIIPVPIPVRKGDPVLFGHDEFIKPDTTPEILSRLKPAFRQGGSVTAGNASGINDGAACLLLASENSAKQHNLKPVARIVSHAVCGVEPRIMGIGPVPASEKALRRAGLSFDDMDVIELNEAFAAQSLACLRAMKIDDDDTRVNPNGGAIALGHPLGMSGARLVLTAARELDLKGGKYALCTMCIGVGQGYAMIIERI